MKTLTKNLCRRDERGSVVEYILITAVFVVLLVAVGGLLLGEGDDKVADTAAQIKDAATDAPSPAATQGPASAAISNNMPDIPWGMIGLIVLGVIALAVAVVIIIFTVNAQAKRKDLYTNNMSQWNALFAKHRDVKTAWADYEMDITKVIDYPAMTDTTDPITLALHKALERASMLQPAESKMLRSKPASSTEYAEAVYDLHRAFAEAEKNAKKVAWSGFTDQERRQLSQAKDLLAMAYNTSASPSERQSAYKQAMKRLEGLIVPPQQAILAIEQRMPILIGN
jgi:Flp pilus assembly pilin Flp